MTATNETSSVLGTAVLGRFALGVTIDQTGGLPKHQEGGSLDAQPFKVWTEDDTTTAWSDASVA